jgi:hypothetical protein
MKRLLSMVVVLAMTSSAFAGMHVANDMLNGCNLIVSNATAVTPASVGLWYVGNVGGFITNIQSGSVNPGNTNIYNPSVWGAARTYTDTAGDAVANVAIAVGLSDTNLFFPPGTALPGSGWMGQSTNFLPAMALPTAATTNVVVFVLQRACRDGNYGTTAQDLFTFAVTGTGLTPTIVNTNVPVGFLTGTRQVRIKSITADNSPSSPGVIVNFVTLSGYVP